MALTLVATPKATNANSYATEAEADAYFEERPASYTTVWTSATSTNKEAALVWATRLLDEHVTWKGYKTTQAQALAHPRHSVYDKDGVLLDQDVIATFLVRATSELALHLLSTDVTAEPSDRGLKEVVAGPVEVVFDKGDGTPTFPDAVRSIFSFYAKRITDPKRSVGSIALTR